MGPANIDCYGLLGNYEMNLEVNSRRFAAQMERIFELDKTKTRELTLEGWERHPLPIRIVRRVLATLSRLIYRRRARSD